MNACVTVAMANPLSKGASVAWPELTEAQLWQRAALLLWQQVPEVGATTLRALINTGKPLAQLWQADPTWMAHQSLLSPKAQVNWLKHRCQYPAPDLACLEPYCKKGIVMLLWGESPYPRALASIYNPPAVLFVQGAVDRLYHASSLAVVGTRKVDGYGRHMTETLVSGLAGLDTQIMSGMAAGVDTVAHQAALAVGLPTVAVFGCGLDIVYPVANKPLAQAILEANGALVSEYPLGTEPFGPQFPARNRIVVGLSKAVLLTQGPLKSGAMITARLASEEGRTVMTVPGDVTAVAFGGPMALLRQGATPVSTAAHIAEELFGPGHEADRIAVQQSLALTPADDQGPHRPIQGVLPPTAKTVQSSPTDPTLLALFNQLPADQSVSVERLAHLSALPLTELMGHLTLLELDGWITLLPGGRLQKVTVP
jgi:DNA processing protein